MNIFFLHKNVRVCAQWHVDRHVVKMILESCQLLCGAWHWIDPQHERFTPPYKATHINHPCAKWVRVSRDNYLWLCDLGIALSREYTHRYDKRHKCQSLIEALREVPPDLPCLGFTPPAQAMPDEYKNPTDACLAYRAYYREAKTHLHKWKKRETPKPFRAVATSVASSSPTTSHVSYAV